MGTVSTLMPLWKSIGGGDVSYLYRDEFNTDRAAGAIDGTPIEPDGGTNRIVTDTGSDMTMSNGWLLCAGSGALGDPAYYMDQAITRTPGMMLVSKIRCLEKNTAMMGWDLDAAGYPRFAWYFLSSGLNVYDNNKQITVGDYTADQEYDLTIITRSKGTHFFIRGGTEFPNQALLMSTELSTLDPLYAEITAATMQSMFGYLRIPEDLWLPTPLVSDGFSSWGTSDGTGHVEGVAGGDALGQGGDGVAWTDAVGTWGLDTSRASPSALDGGVAIATCPAAKNVQVHVTPTSAGGEVGVIVRYVDANNYVAAIHDGTDLILRKVVAGTPTDVDSYTGALSRITIAARDDFFQVYLGTSDMTRRVTGTISDAALQTSAACGIYATNTGNTFDYLQIWDQD